MLAALSFRRISAIYVWLVIIGIFAIWTPDTFLTTTTVKTLLAEQAITAILALGLVVPLAGGAFDLSVGFILGLGTIVVAWLIGIHGFATVPAVALTLAAGFAVGAINGVMITKFNIDSFIATLGVGSGVSAMIRWVSADQTIIGLPTSFESIAGNDLFGIALPVYYMVVLAVILYYVLEHTPWGRYVYATGGNADAAHLAGVRTKTVVVAGVMVSGTIAALAGVLLASSTASGSPTIGPSYLLPAFAAVFLGSTQFAPGRFNILGTVVAVYVLATGVKGLQLAGAPFWIPDMFNCVALLLAVGLSKGQGGMLRRRLTRRRPDALDAPPDSQPLAAGGTR